MLLILAVLELCTFQKKSKHLLINIQLTNIFRIQAYHSIMCGNICIGFIDFMLKNKILNDFTNLFSPNSFKKNDDLILNYFKNMY